MDPKDKGMLTDEKEKEILLDNMEGETVDSRSSKTKKDVKKKKCIKKIVCYGRDVSSSSPKEEDADSSFKKKTVKQNYSFYYTRILYNSNAHLLSIPLDKPPHFDGKDYSFWSHKMRSHLFSLHPSILKVVENGMHFDSSDNAIYIHEPIHKNA
jgi:hypothetical protein